MICLHLQTLLSVLTVASQFHFLVRIAMYFHKKHRFDLVCPKCRYMNKYEITQRVAILGLMVPKINICTYSTFPVL